MRRTLLAFALGLSLFTAPTAFALTNFSGTIVGDVTWTQAEGPYLVETMDIPVGSSLTIEPGTVVKLGQPSCNCYSNIWVGGRLTVGTPGASERAVITSIYDDIGGNTDGGDMGPIPPAPGDWRMIHIGDGGIFELYNSDVRYGGLASAPYIYFNPSNVHQINNLGGTVVMDGADIAYAYDNVGYNQHSGTTTIRNSHIHDTGTGLLFSDGTAVIEQNTFSGVSPAIQYPWSMYITHSGNSGTGGITPSGAFSGHPILFPDTMPYVFSSTLTIPAGNALLLAPGTIVKMNGNFFAYVYGAFNVGSAGDSAPVIITSINDDTVGGDTNGDSIITTPAPGDWLSFYYLDGSYGNIQNAEFRYGGKWNGPTNPTGQIWNQGGEVTVTESSFMHGASNNILQTGGGTTTITDSLIGNASTGISVNAGHFFVHNSRIIDNTNYGIYAFYSPIVVDATHNWWGSLTGPFHSSINILGTGDQVSDNVLFSPYLYTDPTGACVGNCNSNVLFLPGIEASRLFETNVLGDENQLWEPNRNADVEKLYLNDYGVTMRHGVYAKKYDVLNEIALPFVGPNIYKSFITAMNKLKADGLIENWEPIAYDWRLSLQDILNGGKQVDSGHIIYSGINSATTSPYIIQELRHLAATSRTKKVTIIAHSNGGLVAKALLEKLKESNDPLYDKIDKIIFVAVPQIGTPAALAAVLHGYDQDHLFGLVTSKPVARTFASTSPMLYHLLPSAQYLKYVDDPVATFDPITLPDWNARYGTSFRSQERFHQFLVDSFGRVDSQSDDIAHPIRLSDSLLTQAENLHATLDNWTPPVGVEFIQIAGWGIPKTVKGVDYGVEQKCTRYDELVIQGRTNYICGQYEPVFTTTASTTIDGDGTVVVPSALWTSTTTGVSNYWVNLRDYNSTHWFISAGGLRSFDHANILEIGELRSFITDIIASSTKPLNDYEYLSDASPISTDHRLRFSLHSPLSLNLYDDQGRHTGISTTTGQIEEGIPGTYYDEFVDVKYLYTDASSSAHIIMEGYATGTFTFVIDELQGDALISSSTFKDIPTTPYTKVSLSVVSDIFTVSPMSVDQDDNGHIDFSLVPKIGEVVTLPPLDSTAPTTTASTTGTLGTNNWYTSSVIVTLSATDTDSGVASTTYSLDSGESWLNYEVPFTITTEGSTTILFFSSDTAGNRESTSTLTLQIDKTAPEAMISVSTSTQDLLVEGKDALGITTVTKDSSGNFTITDQAGYTTKLFFQKTYSGKRLTYAKLTGIQYDGGTKKTLPSSSFVYLWDIKTPTTLLSQTIAVDGTYLIQAVYDKKKNKTTVLVLKKRIPIKTQTFPGLRIPKLSTTKGVIGYSL